MRAPGTRLRTEQAGDRLTGRFRVVRAAGGAAMPSLEGALPVLVRWEQARLVAPR